MVTGALNDGSSTGAGSVLGRSWPWPLASSSGRAMLVAAVCLRRRRQMVNDRMNKPMSTSGTAMAMASVGEARGVGGKD